MKRLIITITLILTLIGAYSNTKVDFKTSYEYHTCSNANVEFTIFGDSISSDFITFWDFGDGQKYSGTNAYRTAHSYSKAGSYTVTLIYISGSDTIVIRKPDLITIWGTPETYFSYNVSDSLYYAPLTVTFHNETVGLHGDSLKYIWNINNTNISTTKDTTITFSYPGTYDVLLNASDSTGCTGYYYKQIVVKDTAQRGEFDFIKGSCNYVYSSIPKQWLGKHYKIENDSLKIFGLYNGNCGATKTATIRNTSDTIFIKTWQVGSFTTCYCDYYFEINIPNYTKDSAIVYFDSVRVQHVITGVPQVQKLEKMINISPNPVTDKFQINSGDNLLYPMKLVVRDVDGRIIKESNLNSNKSSIDISQYAPGVYVVYLYLKEGFVTRKIIKL